MERKSPVMVESKLLDIRKGKNSFVGLDTCLGPSKRLGNTVRDEKTVKRVCRVMGGRCIMTIMSSGGVAGQDYLGIVSLLVKKISSWTGVEFYYEKPEIET